MREALASYVNRVKELADHVKGNEQATKHSLVGPLLTLLGYDLTDPRQCFPEYRVDFGKERSVKPIDWAFFQNGHPSFFVEVKEAGKRLSGYDEQLADYFAKAPEAKLGILTNGVHWRFFTDMVNENVMDKEPFVQWDVLTDEQPPIDFLTVLQKSEYNSNLLRTFAQRTRQQNLLVQELARLLEPAPEFTKLAIARIETRNLTAAVVESWKPIVGNAINEWARQRALASVLETQARISNLPDEPQGSKVETTQEELDAFATVQRLFGPERPIAYEDTVSYFKMHIQERRTAVFCRLLAGRKKPCIWLPMAIEKVVPLSASVARRQLHSPISDNYISPSTSLQTAPCS
jgi:predicted type IV restriction endonuclease